MRKYTAEFHWRCAALGAWVQGADGTPPGGFYRQFLVDSAFLGRTSAAAWFPE